MEKENVCMEKKISSLITTECLNGKNEHIFSFICTIYFEVLKMQPYRL